MRFRVITIFALIAMLSACSPFGGQESAPTPASAPTTAASEPTSAPSLPTTVSDIPAVTSTASAEATSAASTSGAGYAKADCPFEVPQNQKIECGYLTVPENRTTTSGKTIKIAVGVFKTASTNPKPDPIVYLEGGPGGNALENWAKNFEQVFAPIARDRDFIIFDQRGTGYSQPSLACQEVTDEAYAELDQQLTIQESINRNNAAMLKCHDRLAKEGVDFSGFNSVESAADLSDLRQALGYKEWNVYGISYGTRLALTTMREHPEGIRSVIIDSVVPLQASEADTPVGVDRAFRQFFDGCAADAACNKAYPNLETTFYKLVDDMNAKPVEQEVQDPADGKSYKILLTGDSMIGILFFSLYQTSVIPLMPRAIADAAAGTDYNLIARLGYAQTSQNKDISIGMYYAVRCNEEVPFDTPEKLSTADDAYPKQRGLFDVGNSYNTVCPALQAGKAPAVENEPVTSDLPTLVTSGQYDPVTPPADAQAAASTLSRSYFFEFPGYGHGVSIDGDCPVSITTAFIDNPTAKPDGSCINDLKGPAWAVPEGPVELQAFDNSDAGVKGVVPKGWEKVGSVAYTNRSGDSAILQFRAGQDKAGTLDLLKAQFKLTENPKPAGEYKGKNYTWSLYTLDVQGSPSNLAIAENGGATYVVMLVTSKANQQTLYDSLFIPALDALQPA